MILLFSHQKDNATKRICEWLDYYSEPFIRINENEKIDIEILNIGENSFEYTLSIGDNFKVDNKDIKSVFFRGGGIKVKNYWLDPNRIVQNTRSLSDQYASYISNYSLSKLEFLIHELNGIKSIGIDRLGRFNKLIALKTAMEVGFDIPNTLFTDNKTALSTFFEQENQIITKSLDIGFSCFNYEENMAYSLYTSELSQKDISDIPNIFSLSKFQTKINKEYELRCFYINKKIYSCAIMSQNNQKTQVDFRRFDYDRPNKILPYKLPEYIENRIIHFMDKVKLNTGSLDLIKSKEGKFIFLEVNPIGQFGYNSDLCNFDLHKVIANELINI